MPDEKNPGGRPLKFESVEELQTQINLHFDDCEKHEDTRRWSHDEIINENGKRVCTNCWAGERTKGCLLVTVLSNAKKSAGKKPDKRGRKAASFTDTTVRNGLVSGMTILKAANELLKVAGDKVVAKEAIDMMSALRG